MTKQELNKLNVKVLTAAELLKIKGGDSILLLNNNGDEVVR